MGVRRSVRGHVPRGLAVGLVVGALALELVAGAGPGLGQEAPPPKVLIAQAREALARGDGIAAEMKLRAALDGGARRSDVAAWMGEAYLDQDAPEKARAWLKDGDFEPGSAAQGWQALARLERLGGNLEAAAKAFDKARAITPDDPSLWVEIGRLLYARGRHEDAIDAANHALELDDRNVRALEFEGQLVRDRYGLEGALPWFEKAIMVDPGDVSVLLDYAATLGDLGRASEAVTVTRRVLELAPGNPRAYYLQAVIAARAGNFELARSLLAHTGGALDAQPAVLQLRGMVELAAGNPETAGEAFEAVLRMKPDSRHTQDLLARAIYLSGQYRYATLRFAGEIARGEASPYLLTVVARAYEVLGNRQRAGELLDASAQTGGGAMRLRVLDRSGKVGRLLAAGQLRAAEVAAEAALQRDPGFYSALSQSGDAQLALGNASAAQARYAEATEIRMPTSLFRRRYEAYVLAGDVQGAKDLVQGYLDQNPRNRSALRAAAEIAIGGGDYARAQAILEWLRANGGARDVGVLCNLALVEAELDDLEASHAAALAAYRLQRSSPETAQALGYSLAMLGREPEAARALFAKAEAMVGRTPLIARGLAVLDRPARPS